MYSLILLVIAVILLNFQVLAQFINGSAYIDSRGFNTLTVEGQSLIGRFQTFGFVDFFTADVNSTDIVGGYGEIKEAIQIIGPHRFLYEFNDGGNSSIHRLGYQFDVNSTWLKKVRILPYTYNLPVGQISLVVFWRQDWFTLSGFTDLSINYKSGLVIYLTEVLFGITVADRINLVIEIEFNNFVDNEIGVAPGIEVEL